MLVLFFASCNCLAACSTPGALPLHLLANNIHSRIVHFISFISRLHSQYMFIVCMRPTGLAFYNVQMSDHLQFAWSSALASVCREITVYFSLSFPLISFCLLLGSNHDI